MYVYIEKRMVAFCNDYIYEYLINSYIKAP